MTWELTGAVVGAGLASGREIASFFARYGKWGYGIAALSMLVMFMLADNHMPVSWKKSWLEKLWNLLLELLLVVTGGAMVSGAGAVAQLILPIRGAYFIGMLITILMAWALAYRTNTGLAWVSKLLMLCLAVIIALGHRYMPVRVTRIMNDVNLSAVWGGVAYGGMNAAIQMKVMETTGIKARIDRGFAAAISAGILLIMLLSGNAVLLRHPVLIDEELPFIYMLQQFGKAGYWLGAAGLYLAVLSTLTACIRGVGRKFVPLTGCILLSLLGFTGVVNYAYPLIGGSCFLMLLSAKLRNCLPNSFHSRKDMV